MKSISKEASFSYLNAIQFLDALNENLFAQYDHEVESPAKFYGNWRGESGYFYVSLFGN